MRFFEIKRSDVKYSGMMLKEKAFSNREYLMSLDSEALLFNFKTEAVLDDPFIQNRVKLHGGWESPTCQLRGHFLGHWLSAAAFYYAATGDIELKAKADNIVAGLALCQEKNGGQWAASIPEKYLDRIAKGERVWAPHYTIHKTFMGLLDMYIHAGNKQALDIADKWSAWFLHWTAQFSREQMDNILDVETGGMLEIWVELYNITKNPELLKLIDRYYRSRLFDPLRAGKDVLTNMHANTTIPEVLGAARAYEVLGDEKWLDIAKAYWRFAVTERGQYCTGGQTCGEVWSPRNELAFRLGEKNQEHCTVYNMMRLADFLLRVTGDKIYADYWEQNLYNGIFAQGYWHGHFTHGNKSDYPDNGLLTYFLPLKAGARKGWSTRTEDFFCCHGTLVQANAIFDRGIYYATEKGIAVCQFFDSSMKTEIGGAEVNISQHIDSLTGFGNFAGSNTGIQEVNRICNAYPHNPGILKVDIDVSSSGKNGFEIAIRIPWWIKAAPRVTLNGKECDPKEEGGYLIFANSRDKDRITVEFKKEISTWPLPDRPDTVGFLYGPVVLAGLCAEEVQLTGDADHPEKILFPDNEREWGMWMNTFKTRGQRTNICFTPLYSVGYESYTIYFPVGNKEC